jgi:hypothetical protein
MFGEVGFDKLSMLLVVLSAWSPAQALGECPMQWLVRL